MASQQFHAEKREHQLSFALTVNDSLGLCCTDLQLLTASEKVEPNSSAKAVFYSEHCRLGRWKEHNGNHPCSLSR